MGANVGAHCACSALAGEELTFADQRPTDEAMADEATSEVASALARDASSASTIAPLPRLLGGRSLAAEKPGASPEAGKLSESEPEAEAAEEPRLRPQAVCRQASMKLFEPPVPSAQDPVDALSDGSPSAWSWPAWALRRSSPVEVYVEDEDPGQCRWVQAHPEKRVVDHRGHDAFLSVQYEWEDEFYLQEFGPEHVRRVGSCTTVLEEAGLCP